MMSTAASSTAPAELKMDTSLPFLPGKNPFDVHVYFEAEQAELAATVKTRLMARFDWLKPGRWTDSAGRLSPHPLPMFEMFGGDPKSIAKVNEVVEWLSENRNGLSVLVHPNTIHGNVRDHSVNAVWLGPPVEVRFWVFHAQTVIKAALVLGVAAFVLRSVLSRR